MALMVSLDFGTHGAEPALAPPKSEWKPLFNGRDLAGWDKHLSVSEGAGPIVPNRDPMGVFTVTNLHGETVIHVSGEVYGAITSHDEFENFHARKTQSGNRLDDLDRKQHHGTRHRPVVECERGDN